MQNAITVAYQTYFPLLVRKCSRLLGDGHEAEDVAQETFIRFAKSALLEADARAITAWLYRTSTRLAIDRLRARRREHREQNQDALSLLLSPDAPNTVGRGFTTGAIVPRGLTDRLQWILPTLAFAYRGGDHGGLEWIPSGGITSWGMGASSLEGFLLDLHLGLGIQLRKRTSPRSALTFGWGAASEFRYHSTESTYTLETDMGPRTVSTSPKLSPPDTWRTTLSAGFAHTLADTVTLQLAVSFQYNVLQDGSLAPLAIESGRAQLALNVGSVQSIGLRPQHLVQVHLSDSVALNFDAALNYRLADRAVHESYLLGASFLW